MAVAIEVQAKDRQPLGMTAAQFLRDYWQKRPLLVRQALPGSADLLSPEDLAGLACEELALSRLIVHRRRGDRWSVKSGPLNEADFAALPQRDWTLLVQDVDKWDAQVADLLAHFRFLPDWRIDDVMISYAADGGSVGAHVDQYDVFLLQGQGQRRWAISTDPKAPKEFRDDSELKLLRQFRPTHEWLLQPGDMLYLPPGVPHHGVAVGTCMTYSIGLRAPAHAELWLDFAESLAARLPQELRYTDPDLRATPHPGEIDRAAIARVAQVIAGLTQVDAEFLPDWYARFISTYRCAQTPAARARLLALPELDRELGRGARLHRNPWTRLVYRRASRGAILYAAGQAYACSLKLAQTLTGRRELETRPLAQHSARDRQALLALINDGHFAFAR